MVGTKGIVVVAAVVVVDWVVGDVNASEDVGRNDVIPVDADGVVTVGIGVFYKNMQIRGQLYIF